MHIPDGFVPPGICLAGYGISGGITWYCLRKISRDRATQANIPKASLLTAAFFVASLIHIPVPPSSIHLVLNGIVGIILGYYAFLAILIGLFFQAVMFQHGGLSTLGVNAIIMGLPAIFAYYLFHWRNRLQGNKQLLTAVLSFGAGASAVLLSASMFAFLLITTISPDIDADTEKKAILLSLTGYSIQAAIEGVFTLMLISFLERVKPELLRSSEYDGRSIHK
ncbi:cobalt transporter CbiM [Myxosarcina sp. GI1]|uniref:cobalt transporter CbiM n=1 Tax=Myxosarcina sp. GI1 TaxID=1541065 RepID=UPI00055F95C2|nr:cobalt transporter CbiM [Myxosarcina sp. GI1]